MKPSKAETDSSEKPQGLHGTGFITVTLSWSAPLKSFMISENRRYNFRYFPSMPWILTRCSLQSVPLHRRKAWSFRNFFSIANRTEIPTFKTHVISGPLSYSRTEQAYALILVSLSFSHWVLEQRVFPQPENLEITSISNCFSFFFLFPPRQGFFI